MRTVASNHAPRPSHAARTMTTAAAGCVVVEVSPSGVKAAKAAAMRVLGYAATTHEGLILDADVVFADMAGLPALTASN
jgi:beta-phosphoglucomutase-like phosphatase (HAD superfamily)